MTSSGVKGVTSSAVDYIRSALLPEQTNSEATASFTRYVYVKQCSSITVANNIPTMQL